MTTPQIGIFALGTSAHAYLEFDLRGGAQARDLVTAVADLHEPRTTLGGVNLVSGFRPQLWRDVVPDGLPAGVTGFDADISGAGGYVMPATQHDAALWIAGSAYDVVFDAAHGCIASLAPVASIAAETSGWAYRQHHDLTGFVDGTKNPSLLRAPEVALVPEGRPGAGGSVLLLQRWAHDVRDWEELPATAQEAVIGRTKPDSIELDPAPSDSHVARTDQEKFGEIFRRNVAYGSVLDHGTMFVGFCASQRPLAAMLDSMAGVGDGVRDALTKYARAMTGAYYFVPSSDAIRTFATGDDGA